MGRIAEFELELKRRSKLNIASWHKIDLHNHSPASHNDYKYKETDVWEKIVANIKSNNLSAVMFADHNTLIDTASTKFLSDKTGCLIIRGVELNIFVNAFNKNEGKVSKELYFHLLVGFDPSAAESPDYWLTHIKKHCKQSTRDCGDNKITGLDDSIENLHSILKDSNAIIIPAHLHSDKDAYHSRSIDVIYNDPEFLSLTQKYFTALEVPNGKTATFFDGKHKETNNLHKTCVQSSDSHQPDDLGWRSSYAQMEIVNFAQLKAALELPFRCTLDRPSDPLSFIMGMHVQGQFLRDLWLTFSPHCNVLIGVKGSGKTSALECLRFALGVDVPKNRKDSVNSHLNAILGAGGKVSVLLKRQDGAKVLIERSIADQKFVIYFEDDRCEKLSNPEGILFPTYILGWHEIEQAAEDTNIRRLYMNTIAGKEQIQSIEAEAQILGQDIQHKHELSANRYNSYRSKHQEVQRLKELRQGLQQLTAGNLITLRDQYQAATDHREALHAAQERLKNSHANVKRSVLSALAGFDKENLVGESPLKSITSLAISLIENIHSIANTHGQELEKKLNEFLEEFGSYVGDADQQYQAFAEEYLKKTAILDPQQRQLLESHRKVMEQTKALARLELERDALKVEVEQLLRELVALCEKVAECLNNRTDLRREKIERFNHELGSSDVRLTVVAQQNAKDFQELSQKYANGARVLGELRSKLPQQIAHLCLKHEYNNLLNDLYGYKSSMFDFMDLSYFLNVFEEDDLRIEFKVGKPGQEFSPIDQLSAGQRCTAIFPVLLRLEQGPLVVDQPEDNLDNRHIAGAIAPALMESKRSRQMIFTSHNANLVVLSDPESIVCFESNGTEGKVDSQGFFSNRDSDIAKTVLEILDGGERALELRMKKYGRSAKNY